MGFRGAVIAGGCGDHAPAPRRIPEREQLVECPPGLEGAGVLPVLELETKIGAGVGADRRSEERCGDNPGADAPFRPLHLEEQLGGGGAQAARPSRCSRRSRRRWPKLTIRPLSSSQSRRPRVRMLSRSVSVTTVWKV